MSERGPPRRRILVTGAAGFIGRSLVPALLERGHEVIAVGRTPPDHPPAEFSFHRLDLLDPHIEDRLRELDADSLVHLAWASDAGADLASPAHQAWTQASMRLAEAFAAVGGRRAVFAGSCFEYDWSGGVMQEGATPLRPATAYGVAKADLWRRLRQLGAEAELSFAWARLFFIYGPHEPERKLVAGTIRSILHGEEAPCSQGLQRRDYLHVQDVATALAVLHDSGIEGEVNIGAGNAPQVREVALAAGVAAGRPELLRFGARPAAPEEPPRIEASVRRLREELGFRPRYDLDLGMAQTVAWWRAQLAERSVPAAGG